MAFTGVLMASCSDSFDDWAAPQTYPQEEAITIPGYAATAGNAVDVATAGETAQVITLAGAALPEGFTLANVRIEATPADIAGAQPVTINLTNEGVAQTAELQALVADSYGMRPVARNFNAQVYVNAVKDGQAVLIDAGKVTLVVTPKAPQISQNYYIIGAPSQWDPTCTTLKFNHSGKDVYEDAIFTIVFPVSEGENWFAVSDDITVESNDWKQVFGCVEGNGNNGSEGKIARRSELSDDGSFKVVVNGDAKAVKMTLDMMSYTYKIEKLNFFEYIGVIGNHNGWGGDEPIASPNSDGKYQGYVWLDGEFKFRQNASWADPDVWGGNGTEGQLAQPGQNLNAATGFYQVDADITANTYSLTPVNSITLVGNHNGWNVSDAAMHMTYNTTEKCWEITTNLTNGFKFAMNDDWTVSWGGANGDAASYDLLTQNNGKDLDAPAGDGTYNVKFYLTCEGKNKVVLTKQ